jgi:hypothetical protein
MLHLHLWSKKPKNWVCKSKGAVKRFFQRPGNVFIDE